MDQCHFGPEDRLVFYQAVHVSMSMNNTRTVEKVRY